MKELPRVPYWMGSDQVIEEEISRFGLHRRELIRRHGCPDIEMQLQGVPHGARLLHGWTWTDQRDVTHLVLAWKEQQ